VKLGIVYHMPFWRAPDGTLREVEGSFARYVDSLAPYFDEVSLCVPVLPEGRGEGTPIRSANVTLAPLPVFDGPLQFYPKLPFVLPLLWRWVRTLDVLHCRVPTPAAVFACAFARVASRPTFLLVVGDLHALLPAMPYRGMKRWVWRAYTEFEEAGLRWMSSHALTFANGRALADKHRGSGGSVIETRTTTITAADIRRRADTCQGVPIRVLTVSRIDPRKGLRVLPDVVRHLVARGLDVTIDIVGPTVGAPGERERAAIIADAERLAMGPRLRCVGAVPLDVLLPTYDRYDVFLLPTLPGEGIPRVLLEAMAAGLPVVTTRVAGIPSLIAHEENGLLVENATSPGVADAVARIVADSGLRRRLIDGGYATARAHTLERQAEFLVERLGPYLGRSLAATPRVA
jgi:glycosyltransferase involved in cell wall biosynthesis